MNLDSILIIFIFLSAASGSMIAYLYGKPILAGASIGFMIGLSPLFLLGMIYFLMQKWRPDRPDCLCGRCRSDEYESMEGLTSIEARVFFYECPQCGRRYRQHGDRFELSTPEGTRPYMRVSRWGRWQRDERQEG